MSNVFVYLRYCVVYSLEMPIYLLAMVAAITTATTVKIVPDNPIHCINPIQ